VRAFSHRKLPALKAQVLIYPVTDNVTPWRSRELFKEGYLLTTRDIAWFDSLYAAAQVPRAEPGLSPLLAPDLRGQCPAIVVTAGFDPLRDEGEAYAAALRAKGNLVVNWREHNLIHGFINYAGFSRESRRATKRIGEELRALLR
jgi:acetyl esterase